MGLFGKRKAESNCCKGRHAEAARAAAHGSGARVKILGSACAKCNALEANTLEALKALGMEPVVDHVTDFAAIASYGVMTTPALVVDGRVVSYGKLLKVEEITAILEKARQ